jgi:hypothetical protein
MRTTRIASWEFLEEPGRLRFGKTALGLVPGALLLGFLCLTCVLWGRKTYAEASGNADYFWCLVAALLFLACLYGLFHHLRSRSNPYTLDRRRDEFSNGYKQICRLSQIARVDVVYIEGVADSGGSGHSHYTVEFILDDGESHTCYVGSNCRGPCDQYAEIFRRFLKLA